MPTPPLLAAAQIALMTRREGIVVPPSAYATIAAYALDPALPYESFNEANFLDIPANAAFTRLFSIQVPQGQLGILEGFANSVVDPADYDALTWQLRVGGAPLIGFEAIQGPLGATWQLSPLFWPLYSNQRIEVVVANSTAILRQSVWAGIKGRFFADALPHLPSAAHGTRP